MTSEGLDEWTVPGNAIRLSLLPPDSFVGPAKITRSFHPLMTYQLFEGETIYGYSNLSVDLQFRQDDMSPALKVKYDRKLEDTEDVKVDDVEEELRKYLPKDTPSQLSLSPAAFKPPGKLINEYKRGERKFAVYRSELTDPETRKLISNMQVLVLFFIEAANAIDIDDDEWSTRRWDVFFVYEHLPDNQFSFIGYCTAHKYFYFAPRGAQAAVPTESPFSLDNLPPFPDEYRARISQFLILPPYQKAGHGRQLYDVIINEYLSNDAVKEITVEDPSEKFEELRDAADFVRLKNKALISPEKMETIMKVTKSTKGWIRTERKIAKMPQRQFMREVEMLLLEQILLTPQPKQSKLFKKYTLYVKERLYRHNKDILMQIEKDERTVKLQETYESVREDYEKTLARLGSSAVKGKAGARSVIAGKRPQSSITTITEGADEEEEEELEPPAKKKRTA